MITRIKEAKSLSSSSAFIIIIVLVIVSVAAIVVGGGDAFSRKYAGIDLREFSGKMLLAQTGVVGKILKFEQDGDIFTLDLLPIELDSTLLDSGERYVTSVVPPREGDTPFSYRPEEGVRVTQGYPILREYTEQHNIVSALSAAASLSVSEEETNELPDIPGMKMCNVGSTVGHFDVFYEDIAYDTNIGFDDPNLGVARQNEICEALNEFEEILLLDELKLKPGIVIQASTEKTPEHTLSVVSPQYVGGSGFVSTLLADYLRSGEKRSDTSFSENVSVLGINSGFMRFSFANDVRWSSDTGNSEDFDMSTVAKQNMLRLLGFGSFIGHEQENILSSTWERWTEWDRLLFDSEYNPLIDSGMKFVNSSISQEDLELSESNEYDNILVNQTPVNISGFNIPDVSTVPFAEVNSYEIFKSSRFLKGESLSGLANEDALSYPILGRGEVKNVSQQEKEILCFLGLGVSGVEGCEDGPRAVAQDIYIERQNNKPVCVNIGRGLESSVAQKFVLAGEIMEMTGNVDIYNSNQFMMFSAPCDGPEFESIVKRDAFANLHQTENIENARSFAWTPSSSESLYREYVQFAFSTKDIVTGRQTDQQTVSIHKCVVTANGNQLCNGDFQFSGATSAIDYKLSALQDVTLADGSTVVACQSTTLPGWCAQGVQDGFSSEFGYTWHPYLIRNPEAFDASINDSPRVYAGGSSGAIIQRLRVPLQQNTSYLVTGKVYVTQDGLRPTFWYGPQNTILRQSDGTYHVHYPEALTGGGPVIREYTLAEPLTEGEWHDFSWTLESGTDPITHIAFGSSNNNGFVLYDNLSVVAINECGTCMSDVDGNCVTNVTDFTTFLDTYGGVCPGETVGCLGDLTFDGAVDTEDILEFISQYGSSCDDGTSDVEICNDRIDNDGDGKIDGADLDCAQSPVEICSDRRDNDGDGLIDMNDPDCLNNIEICDDGIDNDGDGKADILDTDCPQNQVEICSDRRDNDGDGLIDTNDPDCLAGESQIDDSETANSSQRQEAIFIDEDGLVQDITLKAVLFQSEEIIPNANGFTANYVVKIINEGKSVNNLNVIGVLPSMLSYNSHVSTEESVAYDRNTNSILIPSLGRGDVVEIYFNVDITSNVCAQLNNVVSVQAYTLLVQLDLCDEYEEVQSKVYQTRLLEEAVAEGTSSLKASPSTGGGSFGISVSMCADNIDNDGDGLVDKNDQDCYDTNGTSEFGQNECSDKIDNDEDGKIDLDDLECLYSQGVSETDPNLSECADGIDNDGDGKIDYVDRECTTTEGEAEALYGDTECSDGIDNDGDKNIDLEDRDCVDENDDAESVKQCSDGIDNDDDKNIDLNDPECYKDPEDNNESS